MNKTFNLCCLCILLMLCMACKHFSSDANDNKTPIQNLIDINETTLIQKTVEEVYEREVFENGYEKMDSDFDKILEEDKIVWLPSNRSHFKSLHPDSLIRKYGLPVITDTTDFDFSRYDDGFHIWGRDKEDYVYRDLVESNTTAASELLTPILSKINKFSFSSLKWRFKDDFYMEIIYLISDTTLIPIDGWIADKDHFVFNRD